MLVNALPDKTKVPTEYQIGDYPDPFNPHSNIYFTLPKTENVTLTVYNILGQKIKTLVNQKLMPGVHTYQWDATNQNGMPVAEGMYLYIMQTEGGHVEKGKMVYLKESRSGAPGGLYKPTTSTSTESDAGTSVNGIDGDSLEVRVDLAETDSTEAGIVTFYVGEEGVYDRDFTARWKNRAPEVISQPTGYTGQEDNAVYSDSVNAIFKDFNHDDPNVLELIVNGLPEGFSAVHQDCRLYFHAPPDYHGTINVSVTARDEHGLQATTDQFPVTWDPMDRFQGELTDLVQGDARRGILEVDGVQYPTSNGVFDQQVPQGSGTHTVRYWLTDESGDPQSFIVTQQFDQGDYQDLDLAVASSDNLVWDEGGQELVTFQEMRDFHNYGNIGLFGANWRIGLKKPIVPDSVRQVYIVYENPVTGDIMDPEWAQNIKDSINIDILDKVVARFGEDVRIPVHIGYDGDPLMDEATRVTDPPDPVLLPRHGWYVIHIDNTLPGGVGAAYKYDDNRDNLVDRGIAIVKDPNNMISEQSFYAVVEEEFITLLSYLINPPDGDPIPKYLDENQTMLIRGSVLPKPTYHDYIHIFVAFHPLSRLKATLDEVYGMPSLGKANSIAVPQTPRGYERTNPGLLVPKSPEGYDKKETGLFIQK